MDVCSSGERWEGSSVAGIAYGYGCFYDDDNRPLYKGFTWNGKKVLFGIEYFNNGLERSNDKELSHDLFMNLNRAKAFSWWILSNGYSIPTQHKK